MHMSALHVINCHTDFSHDTTWKLFTAIVISLLLKMMFIPLYWPVVLKIRWSQGYSLESSKYTQGFKAHKTPIFSKTLPDLTFFLPKFNQTLPPMWTLCVILGLVGVSLCSSPMDWNTRIQRITIKSEEWCKFITNCTNWLSNHKTHVYLEWRLVPLHLGNRYSKVTSRKRVVVHV